GYPSAADEAEQYRKLLPADKDYFFFQAEDGIRGKLVTGVQTCALPICCADRGYGLRVPGHPRLHRSAQRAISDRLRDRLRRQQQIGRASCRERVEMSVVSVLNQEGRVRIRRK